VQQFREIVNLSSLREQEIRLYNSSDKSKQTEKLQRENDELENKLFEMEVEENLLIDLKQQLEGIKSEEKGRGEAMAFHDSSMMSALRTFLMRISCRNTSMMMSTTIGNS